MKLRLPILAAGVVAAAATLAALGYFAIRYKKQPGAEKQSAAQQRLAASMLDSSGQAGKLVHQAAERLDQYASISAKLRMKADIYDQRIIGNGQYRQGPAASHLLRCDTKLQIGEHVTSWQEIVDGSNLWLFQSNAARTTLRRVELAPVLAAEKSLPKIAENLPHGLGLGSMGGLPKLVRNLDLSVNFTHLAQGKLPPRFAPQGREVPVYVARGTWKPAIWARLLPDQEPAIKSGAVPNLEKLPPQVPDQVVLTLGRDDWFPYRIEFLRTTDDAPKTLFVTELYDVQWNVPLDRRLFVYQPGNLPVNDFTGQFLYNLVTP